MKEIRLLKINGAYSIYLNGKLKITDIRVRDSLEGDRCTEKNTGDLSYIVANIIAQELEENYMGNFVDNTQYAGLRRSNQMQKKGIVSLIIDYIKNSAHRQ